MNDFDEWVICIDRRDASGLAPFAHEASLLALVDGDRVWLRGARSIEWSELLFAQFKDLQSFRLAESGQLFENGRSFPDRLLPDGNWRHLDEIIRVTLPPAKFSVAKPILIDLKLKRTELRKPTNLLVCEFDDFSEWVETAPQCRMDQLVFAVGNRQQTFVKGIPLPQIQGKYFHVSSGIAMPVGFCFSPRLSHQVVCEMLERDAGGLVVFSTTGVPIVYDPIDYVRVFRSAVRATNRKLGEHA